MFDRAKNFALSNGVFTDIGSYKPKIFAKKIYFGSDVGINSHKDKLMLDNPRASEYRRILRGDIKLLNKIEKNPKKNKEEYYEEYIVKVGNDRRWARFYNGERAYAHLKLDFDKLSRLHHPMIAQVFGICESNNRPALVFHDNGEGCCYDKYSAAIKDPIKRAIFYFKYLVEHKDATNYLEQLFRFHFFPPKYISYDIGENEDDFLRVDFNVKMDGRLNITLSVINEMHSNSEYGSTHFGISVNCFPRSERETLQIIQSDLSRDYVWPQSHNQMAVLIKKWLCAVTSVNNYKYLPSMNNVLLGQEFTVDTIGNCYAHGSYFEAVLHGRLHFNSWCHDISNVFQPNIVKIGSLTRFELTIDGVARWAQVHGNGPTLLRYQIWPVDELYQSWLAGVTQLRYPLSSFGTQFGIVTNIFIEFFVHIYQFRLLQYMKENPGIKIYLFISGFGANQRHGNLIQPNAYWSLDQTGVERLSGFSALQKGLAELHITDIDPFISYRNHTFHEALHGIYHHLNLTVSDVVELLGLQKRKYNREIIYYSVRSLSRMDALNIRSSVGKEEIIERKQDIPDEWKYCYSHRNWDVPFKRIPDANSLSWIGITILEDYWAVHASWYETVNSRLKRRKQYEQELGFLKKHSDEDWIKVTETDIAETIVTNEVVEGIASVEEWEELA